MKGVWFSLVALALGVAGVVSVVPSIAEAAGLTRAEVLAAIAGRDVSGGVPGEAPLAATAGSGALK
ncbi:MAG: hypothetical protein RXR20_35705 [Paraburkholderia sp.]|uniref:hypothetical protein n=1 Tax=Burkholderiaceae TaxID=119060 RepID=UPI0010F4FEF3|nr:hypothetical protein [Burkholderia sp. 4M9327F10]